MTVFLITPRPTHPVNSGNRVRVQALAEAVCIAGINLHVSHLGRGRGAGEIATGERWGSARCHFIDPKGRPRRKTLWRRAINKAFRLLQMEKPAEPCRIDDWCGDEMVAAFA